MADTPEMTEEEKMAAEWAAASEGGAPAEGESTARVLSQNEIDSLLGFGDAGGTNQENSGIMALINSALVNYERLPMLEVVFDRLVRMMSTSLRNFTSDNVEVSLDQITSVRFGDYLNSIPLPAMLTVFKAEEWDNSGLMTIDSAMIYSIVDVLLGGRRGTASYAYRRPPLHHHRTQSGRTACARRSGRYVGCFRSFVARHLPLSTASKPIRALPPSRARPTPPFWPSCASIWKIAAAASKS